MLSLLFTTFKSSCLFQTYSRAMGVTACLKNSGTLERC